MFQHCIEQKLESQDAAQLDAELDPALLPKDIERKHLVDQAFKDLLKDLIVSIWFKHI